MSTQIGVPNSVATRSSQRVAVIGGGVSGLATATYLRQLAPASSVTLFEAADHVGGVIQTRRHGEFLVDYGADMFATSPPHLIQLLEKLGVSDRLISPQIERAGALIVFRGRLEPIPAGFVLMRATQLRSMITTPLLSWRAKLRLALEAMIPKRSSQEDESVAAFVRRRMGHEILDRIVGPLVAGIYTADCEQLSMLATMAPIAAMEQEYGSLTRATLSRKRKGEDSVERASSGARYSQFRAFAGGMIQLIQSLEQSIPARSIRLQTTIKRLSRTTAGDWELASDAGSLGRFDHVVLSTPTSVTAKLLEPLSPVAARELASIQSASVAIVVLGTRKADIDAVPGFGFVVPPIENRRILAVSFSSEKFAGRASADQLIVRVFIGGVLQSELLAQDDQSLIQIAREELADLIGLKGTSVFEHVVRWTDAMPQYTVGHLDRVATIEQGLATFDSLHLAGNGLYGVGIAPVVQTAHRIAAKITGATTI